MHSLRVMLALGIAVALATGTAWASDEPITNQTKDSLQAHYATAIADVSAAVELAAERAEETRTRLLVSDYMSFLNGARLADLGYAAADDTALNNWHGSLTYSAGVMQRGGRSYFDHGTRLELGYHSRINNTLEIGLTIVGGLGNLPGDSWFGFSDHELNDEAGIDSAWIKLSAD